MYATSVEVLEGNYAPFELAVQIKSQSSRCSGVPFTLNNKRFVLTAAHCVKSRNETTYDPTKEFEIGLFRKRSRKKNPSYSFRENIVGKVFYLSESLDFSVIRLEHLTRHQKRVFEESTENLRVYDNVNFEPEIIFTLSIPGGSYESGDPVKPGLRKYHYSPLSHNCFSLFPVGRRIMNIAVNGESGGPVFNSNGEVLGLVKSSYLETQIESIHHILNEFFTNRKDVLLESDPIHITSNAAIHETDVYEVEIGEVLNFIYSRSDMDKALGTKWGISSPDFNCGRVHKVHLGIDEFGVERISVFPTTQTAKLSLIKVCQVGDILNIPEMRGESVLYLEDRKPSLVIIENNSTSMCYSIELTFLDQSREEFELSFWRNGRLENESVTHWYTTDKNHSEDIICFEDLGSEFVLSVTRKSSPRKWNGRYYSDSILECNVEVKSYSE